MEVKAVFNEETAVTPITQETQIWVFCGLDNSHVLLCSDVITE